MKDLFLVFIGGFCAAFGGFASTWYRAKRARKIKMRETIGEQQVEAYKNALSLISQLKNVLIQGIHEDAVTFMTKHNQWISENTILLPHEFVQNWWSIRSNLSTTKRKDEIQAKMTDGLGRYQLIEEVGEADSFMDNLAEKAGKKIRKELGLPDVKIQRPPKAKKSWPNRLWRLLSHISHCFGFKFGKRTGNLTFARKKSKNNK